MLVHSVSHKLILELNGSDFSIITVSKEHDILSCKTLNFFDDKIIKNLLDELPEVYADVNLLVRKTDFITIPEDFFEVDFNKIYSLSYLLNDDFILNIDKTDYGVGIVYPIEKLYFDLIISKFSRVMVCSEASLILKKIFKVVNFQKPKILISLNQEKLIVFVVKDNKLQLCNPYITKSDDDTFYYVMLAIEQLHLQPEDTELVILGEPPHRKAIFELFKNYINEINIWLEEYNSPNLFQNKQIIDRSFALQQLLCG